VAGSLATGALAAALLAVAPFVPATENGVAAAVLLGLALGWSMLAVLSFRFTDRPQTWAAAPALFLGLAGLLTLTLSPEAQEGLAWVWPPALLATAAWMFVRASRQLQGRTSRVLVLPVIALLALASAGGGYETVQKSALAAAAPAQGKLIDVGGHRLYLNCTGTGGPTVVLEPGAGGTSTDLELISSAVARDTRVCVYDRAGRGWSDPTDGPQDATRIASDLHTLLDRANVPGPYVLAGHSFGGLYALTFAARYPQEVAGLALIDSTSPAWDAASGRPAGTDAATADRISALVSSASKLGLGRLLGVTPAHLRSTVDEYVQAGSSAQQAAALSDFAGRPLAVLTAGSGSQSGWAASQETLAGLSTNSLHRVIAGATHASFITDPKDAAAATQGILDVVAALRTARPLLP
jgi:pimeloyl-ACP methyl ester carboxylesterase